MHLRHTDRKIVIYPDNSFTRKFVDECDKIYPGFNFSKYLPDSYNAVEKDLLNVPNFKSVITMMKNERELEEYN